MTTLHSPDDRLKLGRETVCSEKYAGTCIRLVLVFFNFFEHLWNTIWYSVSILIIELNENQFLKCNCFIFKFNIMPQPRTTEALSEYVYWWYSILLKPVHFWYLGLRTFTVSKLFVVSSYITFCHTAIFYIYKCHILLLYEGKLKRKFNHSQSPNVFEWFTYVEWCPRTTMAFHSFLFCIAVCTSNVSSPVSCFRTSTYVRGGLSGFLLPCFWIQWISLYTGSLLFLKQWPAKRPLLSMIFCESFGTSPSSPSLGICCFQWMFYTVLSILV